MSDWKARREALLGAAASGDVEGAREQLAGLLELEQTPRVFALGAKVARALRDAAELRAIRLLILRSYTVEPMIALLETFALRRGVALTVEVADYDQFEQVLLADDERAAPDVVLLLARVDDLDPALATSFAGLDAAAAADRVAAAPRRAAGWLAGARQRWPSAAPVLAGVTQPRWPALGLADAAASPGHRRAIEEVNEGLRAATRACAGAVFFDAESVIADIGRARAFDRRMWAHARQPYSLVALAGLADRLARLVAARFVPRRKCIVLDCDNTLWGGVIGEDGISGIALGPEHPGSAFVGFQRGLLALQQRGVILAIASKNNEADVLEVLGTHRHQVLRPEHIAAHVINWGDKATSIEQIAAELNIGIDSMIFIDDSDYECALVRERLPAVEVHKAPDNPLELESLLTRLESLDALEISADDRERGAMYKAQAERNRAEVQAPSLDDFLRTLDLEIEIRDVSERGEIERAAQLCQRTNQLNVTTRRHQIADIERFVGDPSTLIRIARLRDRFGDYGMCGLVIAHLDDSALEVDTLLLSCRVIGRGVESALAVDLERCARGRGARRIDAEFIATAKNSPARELFDSLGFARAEETASGARYQKSLDEEQRDYPDWFKVVE